MTFRLNGWDNSDAQKVLAKMEKMIKEMYHDLLVDEADLKIRDTVINRVKDAFFDASKKDYP